METQELNEQIVLKNNTILEDFLEYEDREPHEVKPRAGKGKIHNFLQKILRKGPRNIWVGSSKAFLEVWYQGIH